MTNNGFDTVETSAVGPNEASPVFSDLGGRFLSARISGHACDPHFHETYSIALVRRGTANCTIRDSAYTVSPGDVMIINPYEIAFGGNDDDEFEYDVLYPSDELINDLLKDEPDSGGYHCFDEAVVLAGEHSRIVFEAVDAYLSVNTGPKSYQQIEASLGVLMNGRKRRPVYAEFSQSNRDAVMIACELIQNSHRDPVDLAEIGERVGLSRYYFIRLFQKYTRLTPSAYLRQVRLAEARRLIIAGSSLAGAAAEAGFADQAHMTRVFKHTFGFTPGQLMRGINSPEPSLEGSNLN